ncbi:TonB-dependent receptor [Fodinibius sp.]|uniref:TonB-dependent receptor n=1 Tax=Fodinibius sp. TaxID=1872440 RepID=UPI002ACE2931|nr:TonB-dependent receptor [Fodinibius sp.]MDZ7658757.1 TonB-dependent receptor [Fodinibius sp.]
MKKFLSLLLSCCFIFTAFSSLQAQTATIKGQLTDDKTGEAIQGANIYLSNQETEFSSGAATNNEGRYTIRKLAGGSYQLKITAVGYQSKTKQVTLKATETQVLDIKLQPIKYELSEIVVSHTEQNFPKTTTIQQIEADEIKNIDLGTVADVARLLPAAHVATNSRGQTILYLRNSADRQTAQFFNGALINVPWDNRVDIGFLPSSMLGGVTVSKGVPSVVYGTNTIGGAVNFRTRSLSDQDNLTELNVSGSSPGLGGASVVHMGTNNNFSYTTEVGYTKQYDYKLPNGATTPFSQPSNDTRVNTDRRNANLFFEGTQQFESGARLSASLFHVDAEQGVAPESNLDPSQTSVRYWRYPTIRQSMVILNGMVPLDSDTRVRGSAWFNRYTQDIYQYQSVDYENLDQTQADLDLTGGLRFILERDIGGGQLNIALNALTTQHEQTIVPYLNNSAQADSNDTYGQQIYSIGAEYTFPLSQDLTGMLSLSYEGSAITNTGPWENQGFENYLTSTLSLSAGLTYNISEQLRLRSSFGRKPRFPTMRELYGGALGKFVPNPNLKPVTAYLGEIGIERVGTTVSSSLTTFLTRTYGTIDKRTIQQGPNAGKEQRINLDGTRIWGVETKLTTTPVEQLSIDGSFTYMHTRGVFQGDPRKLDEKPTWVGKLNITYDLTNRLSLLSQTEYTGGIYNRNEQNNFVLLPDALIFDGRISYDLFQKKSSSIGGELFFRVNNITNDLRVLQLGLPGPGRKLLAGVKVQF